MKTIKIRGLPGTGKTTLLQKMIEQRINGGAKIEDIICSSFSRATIYAISKKIQVLGYSDKDIRNSFRTLHSFAARTLSLKDENYITVEDNKIFCMKHGIPFKPFYVRTPDEIEGAGAVSGDFHEVAGNIMFRWWQLLKKKYVYNKKIHKAIKQRMRLTRREELKLMNFSPLLLLNLYEEWEDFKMRNNKWEYDDPLQYIVLHEISFPRPIRYMIIDEAQDLSKLQMAMVNIWADNCDELIISGDENQAIYFFNSADPTLFQNLEGEERLLPISYRVPRLPWETARKVARFIGDGAMKKVQPKESDGSVTYLNYREVMRTLCLICDHNDYEKNNGNDGNNGNNGNDNTFLLFRTHREIGEFLNWCFSEGIYPLGMGRHVTVFNYSKNRYIYSLLCKLYNDRPLVPDEVNSFITSIPAKYLVSGIKTKIKKNRNWVKEAEKQKDLLCDDYDNISYFYSLFKNNGLDSPEGIKKIILDPKTTIAGSAKDIFLGTSPRSPPVRTNVRIGTFFASKGLEAGNVFSFDYFPRQDADIKRAESRIVFVGLTRTSNAEYIVSPQDRHEEGLIWDLTG